MLATMTRANRGVDSLPGVVSVREFAACEFPREDVVWVAAQSRPAPTPKVSFRARWARFWRGLDTHGEAESDSEAIPEPAPA
jgi:hypothetical protein